jgi:hypothetical protein
MHLQIRTEQMRIWRPGPILGIGGSVLAIAIASALWIRPASVWTPVAEALRKQPWVHGKTIGPDGQVQAESWLSGNEEIIAYENSAEMGHLDYKLKVFARYDRDAKVVFRLPDDRNKIKIPNDASLYKHVLSARRGASISGSGIELVRQTRTEASEGNRKWLDLDLAFRVVDIPEVLLRVKMRVDPKTNLPSTWQTLSDEGWSTTTLDYPHSGPADIYSLGAPLDAKVSGRVSISNPERVLAGFRAGRNRFDDYCAFVVGDGRNVQRVWKRGRKWRADRLLPGRDNWPPPHDVDASWWSTHQADYVFTTAAICDGEKAYYYELKDHIWDSDVKEPPPIRSNGVRRVAGPADDPIVPWPHLMPEQLAHPSILLPTEFRALSLESNSDDGPSDSIRLRVRDSRLLKSDEPDLHRLWIDPERNFLCLQAESCVFDAAEPPKIAYIDTYVLETLARSPRGYWYPTRVRRKTSNFAVEQVTHFYLDFEAKIPDELFEPLKFAE